MQVAPLTFGQMGQRNPTDAQALHAGDLQPSPFAQPGNQAWVRALEGKAQPGRCLAAAVDAGLDHRDAITVTGWRGIQSAQQFGGEPRP